MQLEQMLLARPRGLRRSEIARRLGVHRSTAARYVTELGSFLPVNEDDLGLIAIDRDSYLNNIRLTIHESLSVYLASRLMADRMDRFNPHAASALRKLGQSLQRFAPTIATHITAEAEKLEGSRVRRDPVDLRVLETLTRGWSESRVVKLLHHSVHRGADDTYLNDSNYYGLPFGRMGRMEAPIGQGSGLRCRDGRGEKRTVAETVGREGHYEELGNFGEGK